MFNNKLKKFHCINLNCEEIIYRDELQKSNGWYIDMRKVILICPDCLEKIIADYIDSLFEDIRTGAVVEGEINGNK